MPSANPSATPPDAGRAPEIADDFSDFRMEEQPDSRNGIRLILGGELDLSVADLLSTRINTLLKPGRTLFLDLRQLQFIDSSGIRVLIGALGQAREDGYELNIGTQLTPQVRHVVDLLELAPILWPVQSSR